MARAISMVRHSFVFPMFICGIATLLNVFAFGAQAPEVSLQRSWKDILDKFIFIFFFIGVGEEPGWRGFALPHFQTTRSPLKASIVLAFFWAIRHLPLFLT
jgi:CAAX protease family protein